MQFQNKKESKKSAKKIIVIILIVLVILAGMSIGVYAIFKQDTTSKKQVIDKANEKEVETNKQQLLDAPAVDTRDPAAIPESTHGTIAIIKLVETNGLVQARVNVSNVTVDRCVYQFESDGAKPVVKEFQGACDDLELSALLFDKIGTYTLKVTAYSGQDKLETSGTIDIT